LAVLSDVATFECTKSLSVDSFIGDYSAFAESHGGPVAAAHKVAKLSAGQAHANTISGTIWRAHEVTSDSTTSLVRAICGVGICN
jgi:hypothetical protein